MTYDSVIPAQAGIQCTSLRDGRHLLDPRLRGDDETQDLEAT